jgi:superfamily II DNA/RNA helicase
VASSITGSGKTAAFLIPIIQRYFNVAAVGYIRTLVVTPTRELAIQIFEEFQKLNQFTNLEAALAIGASSK